MVSQNSDPRTDPAADGEGDRIQSLDQMNTRQDRIESKLDQLLGMKQDGFRQEEDAVVSGRPPTVAEQVRAELARADDERKTKAAADARDAEHQSAREELAALRAKMTETAPKAPQPRRQKLMWGKHDG